MSRRSFLLVAAAAAMLIASQGLLANAFKGPLKMCRVSEEGMGKGMGGANTDLGFEIGVANASPTGADVSIVRKREVAIADDPSDPDDAADKDQAADGDGGYGKKGFYVKGMLLWAADAEGNNVGTWTTTNEDFAVVETEKCPKTAITQKNASKKKLDSNKAISGFHVAVSADAKQPVTLRGVVVGKKKKMWQYLAPVNLADGAVAANAPAGGGDKAKQAGGETRKDETTPANKADAKPSTPPPAAKQDSKSGGGQPLSAHLFDVLAATGATAAVLMAY